MKYFVETSWTGVVDIINAPACSDTEVEQAASAWLADRLDLKELLRGISVRAVHGHDADERIRLIRPEAHCIDYEAVDDDGA